MKNITDFQSFLNERKNYGDLYHFTHHIDSIIEEGGLRFGGNDLHNRDEITGIYGQYSYSISVTRNKNFVWADNRIMLNGEAVTDRYKVVPIHYFNINRNGEGRLYVNHSGDDYGR